MTRAKLILYSADKVIKKRASYKKLRLAWLRRKENLTHERETLRIEFSFIEAARDMLVLVHSQLVDLA
jgi:hypothetical protein